ncbi:putative porin [Pigmentiphaga soli]|uniref:Porin n=2 Tax=Pigmentiphaga soli TaxID=1007095 RepID=A0ABP8GDX9_9BURK
MVRLIRGLIQSGALSKDVGEALLAQAQTEAMALQKLEHQATAPAAAPAQAPATAPQPGDVRVPYISQTVRDEIRNELKGEVLAQAKAEGWAAPNEAPEWTKRIHIEGDVRVRSESRFFDGGTTLNPDGTMPGNSNIEVDWGAINKGSGYDVNQNTNLQLPPLINTRQDRRNLLRVRARLGVLADLSENTQVGVRLASGSDDSPVSTTQTLGGGLDKKNLWLDQVYASYRFNDWLKVIGGRFGNPFMSTDMVFSGDLNFDGVAARVDRPLEGTGVSVFGTLGFIPLEYLSDSFPSQEQNKEPSHDKWLLGAQVGANWKIDDGNRVIGAAAFYDYSNISGRLSDPCSLYSGATSCNTDWTRPAFMQRGNTLMMLRNIALNPLDPANTPMPQYVGLASKFQVLDLNLRWDTKVMGKYGLRLDLNYARNLAYDEDEMFRRAGLADGIVNNYGKTASNPTRADFRSGPNAYMIQATFGNPTPSARGDWNLLAGYKRIEPDALPDAYNDSSFHGGGTNARGYFLGASYAVDKNAWFTGRWLGTKEVYGPPVSIDTLQVEFNARF